jgi:hypothetical protein
LNEGLYRLELTKKLKEMFPGCVILRIDPAFIQGIPDILILFEDKWAMLEVKISEGASIRPNQQYYVDLFDEMSFASFINPSNEEDVLYDLQLTFGVIGAARLS